MARVSESAVPEILSGEIIDTNIGDWTVDVHSNMTGRTFPEIAIASPYLHHFAGEGIYALPEVGANCMVCVPGDTTAPFLLCFVAPPLLGGGGGDSDEEDVDETSGEVTGQQMHGGYASFGAQRPPGKPGDIVMRGRDGNHITLHRGGVLQIGANELAQRIYIPLRNLMMDISGRYEHHSTGGSINWGMQEGQFEENDTQFVQTFRLYADDKYADLRIASGKVLTPTKLPSSASDDKATMVSLGIGQDRDEPMVYEVTLAPGGFNNNGELSTKSAHNVMKFTFQVDRAGNAITRFSGNMFMSVQKNLFIRVKEDLTIEAKNLNMQSSGSATVGSTGGATKVTGDSADICGAGPAAARQGDTLVCSLPPAISSLLPPGTPAFLFGSIMTGSSKVKIG